MTTCLFNALLISLAPSTGYCGSLINGKNLNSSKSKILEKPATEWCFKALLLTLLVVLIVSIVILSCVPPISRDALTHHLALPKLYLRHGGIFEIPFIPFSYFPMNLDLLYLIPLYFGNDIVPKFIHYFFALLTSVLIFSYLRKRINLQYGLLGAIFFLSIPIIIKLSITVYVDLGLIFFSTASLLLLLKWVESGFQLRYLVFSASCCGLAMGTKYNGLITFFLLTLFVPFIYSRYSQGKKSGLFKSSRYGILFLLVALVFFSPWITRNYIWTNNPIYPLYDHWFNPESAVNRQVISLFTYRSVVYQEDWWQIALLPLRIFFQGEDGSPQYFDGKLNLFLLLLPPFAFYRIRKEPGVVRSEIKIMLTFSVLFFMFAFFSNSLRIRYISPIIPPLVILSIFGVRNMVEEVKRVSHRSLRNIGLAGIVLILSLALWLNAYYLVDQFKYVDPFSYLGGTLSRDRYIDRYRLEYPTMRYINENLPPDVRILFIFLGNRGYYCDREYIFDMNNNRSMLKQFLIRSDTTEELLLSLQGLGITHLLICYGIFDRWVKDSLTIKEREFLKQFFQKHIKLIYFKSGYGLSRFEHCSF